MFYKIKKEIMEDILKDLKNVKSSDELRSFKPSTLPFKKFAMDRHFHIKDIDNMMESKLSSYAESGKSLNIGDEVFDCEYENFGIKFKRYVKRISVDLYEYVYKPTNKADFECSLEIEDFEDLATHGELELNIFEDEVPLKIATSKPIQSEFTSEPLSFDSRDTDSKDSGSDENSDCIGFEVAILRGTSSSKILRSNSP
jgi:hypothetical protein